jgi:hypothetical protein
LHCAFSWSWMKWSEETGEKNFSSNPVMSSWWVVVTVHQSKCSMSKGYPISIVGH